MCACNLNDYLGEPECDMCGDAGYVPHPTVMNHTILCGCAAGKSLDPVRWHRECKVEEDVAETSKQ